MGSIRTAFDFGARHNLGHWFPRHMGKGLRQMRNTLSKVDCIVEVHDCRIPVSGRNPALAQVLSSKPKLLVLNKSDMADPSNTEIDILQEKLRLENTHDFMFASCLPRKDGTADRSVTEIIPRCVDIINRDERYDRETERGMDLMIVGIPNVGKSSLINALRRQYMKKKKGAPVAKSPGHTRSVMFKIKVCETPLIFVHDTPGILEPRISDLHSGMKLAMCNTIQDHLVGKAMIADYLLFTLNQKKEFKYMQKYGFPEPCDDIQRVLHVIATSTQRFQLRKIFTGTGPRHVKIPDYEAAASTMLSDFREGSLGRFIIDDLQGEYT